MVAQSGPSFQVPLGQTTPNNSKQLLSLNLNSSHAFDAFEIHLLPGSFTMGKQTDKTDVCIGLFWQRDSNACCASLKYHAYIQEE